MIARFTLEIEYYLCACVASMEIEKIRPKGVITYMYSASVYYMCTSIQILISIRAVSRINLHSLKFSHG